jgi:Ca2+-binding RTX toxin-like protein
MGSASIQRKALATVGVAAGLLAGAATIQAMVGWQPASGSPRVRAETGGSMALADSEQGGAIFTIANIAPGDTGVGEVTITNAGTLPGQLSLASTGITDTAGRIGGLLSQRLQLRLEDIGSGNTSVVYSGGLAEMPELQLGSLAAGESGTYRFLVTMLDGGSPSSPFTDDNAYQRARTAIGYEWTLTEIEGGSEPEPPVGPRATPPVPPTAPAPSGGSRVRTGTPRADTLLGSSEDDVIYGRGGADRIYGKGGRDLLVGGTGADRIHGGAGADRLRGGAGRDRILGEGGADTIFARGGGVDLVDCGGGRDRAHVDAKDRVRHCESVRGP